MDSKIGTMVTRNFSLRVLRGCHATCRLGRIAYLSTCSIVRTEISLPEATCLILGVYLQEE